MNQDKEVVHLRHVVLEVEKLGGCYVDHDVTHRVKLSVARFSKVLKTIVDVGRGDETLDEEGMMLIFMALTKREIRQAIEEGQQ